MSIIRMDGFDFSFDPSACEECPGYCCCGESGKIWVSQQEILQICSLLQMNPIDFTLGYLNRIGNRFSIKERPAERGFECVFFQSSQNRCSIYAARPFQCRQYPFWEHFKKHKEQVIKECPGIIT
jgi:Fe-S-cluster containining protein